MLTWEKIGRGEVHNINDDIEVIGDIEDGAQLTVTNGSIKVNGTIGSNVVIKILSGAAPATACVLSSLVFDPKTNHEIKNCSNGYYNAIRNTYAPVKATQTKSLDNIRYFYDTVEIENWIKIENGVIKQVKNGEDLEYQVFSYNNEPSGFFKKDSKTTSGLKIWVNGEMLEEKFFLKAHSITVVKHTLNIDQASYSKNISVLGLTVNGKIASGTHIDVVGPIVAEEIGDKNKFTSHSGYIHIPVVGRSNFFSAHQRIEVLKSGVDSQFRSKESDCSIDGITLKSGIRHTLV